ncbi:MAG: DUF4919 domain-containing protein [Myxococcota bacterium]
MPTPSVPSTDLRGIALLLGLCLGCAAPSAPSPGSAPADVSPRWESAVDFAGLRTEYGEREDFSARCEDERPLTELMELAGRQAWDRALAVSERWLESCPVDMDAHYIAAVALTELDREPEARLHVDWYRGLVESVLASGDGHSPETAWRVISVPEEYSILRALRVDRKEQSLLEGRIDVLTVEVEGRIRTLYFDPEPHFRRLQRKIRSR